MEDEGVLSTLLTSTVCHHAARRPAALGVAAGALIVLVAACSGRSAEPTPSTTTTPTHGTIIGEVRITGDCPVLAAGETCPDEPYAATIQVEQLDGTVRRELASGADGRFQADFPPGRYRLTPVQPQPGAPPAAEPQTIGIKANDVTHVSILYDRGVRS